MFEIDRWEELVFCLLNQCHENDPENTRTAIGVLKNLGLLEIDRMTSMNKHDSEAAIVTGYTLKQYAFSEKESNRAVMLLSQIARFIKHGYNGRMQLYLRRHGEAMRDELTLAFRGESLSDSQLRFAVTQWLQNALFLPISLEHPAVVEFCKQNEVTLKELVKAADELNLNLALLDDMLELEQKSKIITKRDSENLSKEG